MKAQRRIPPKKDRRDRGPPPEQWKCWGGVPSPLRSDLCTAQLLFQVPCWAVTRTMSVALLLRNNPKRKKSNFRSPAPPQSLLMISSGLLQGPAPPPSSWSRLEPCCSRTWRRRHGPRYRSLGAGDNDDHHEYPGWSALIQRQSQR